MNRLLPALFLCWASIAAAQIVIDPSPQAELTNRTSQAITAPAGATSLIPFTADPTASGGDLFDVISSNPGVVITLLLPNNTEITSANAASQGFVYTVIPDGTFSNSLIPTPLAASGTHTVIQFAPSLAPGTYQIKANASSVATDSLIIATYFSTSSVRAGLLTVAPLYRVGDTVILTGLLFNGSSPIAGATVTASVGDPLDTVTKPVLGPLQDSGTLDAAPGDGIYTGTYTATKAGRFSAAMKATGTTTAGPFSRTASTTFRVLPPFATFTSFSDAGVDDNSNSLIDRVVVTATVNVQTAGKYEFGASLAGAGGALIKSTQTATLATGTRQIAISFSAANVLTLGANGPYTIKQATLVAGDDADTPVVDFRDPAGNTSAYQLSALDQGPLFLSGQNTATGLDTNANGKFETLKVQAGIVTASAGFFQWSASLADQSGKELDFFGGSGSLTAGANTITFNFSGSKIGGSCANGPYTVRSVLIFGAGTSIVVQQLFQTQTFSVQQFENSNNCAPPMTLACPAATTGQLSTAYNSSLVVTGGTAPYAYSIGSGTLPTGLTLDAATGAITGTPTTAGPFPFTGSVTDSTAGTALTATTGGGTITIAATPPPPPPPRPTTPPAPTDFAMTVSPASQSVVAGGSAAYTIALSSPSGNYTGTVSLSCAGLPSGAQCVFSSNPASVGSVTLTVTTAATTPIGASAITIIGRGTTTIGTGIVSVTHSVNVTLAVSTDFAMSLLPAFQVFQRVVAGASATYTLELSSVTGGTLAGPVSLSCAGLPSGAQCVFSSNPASVGNVTITVTTAGTTPAGISTITITGTDVTGSQTATFGLVVAPAPPPIVRPSVAATGITNAASFRAGLVPGGIVTIFGTSLTTGVTGVVVAVEFPLPTSLKGTSITVNGIPAPLIAISNVDGNEQINLQIPQEVAGQGTAIIIVTNNGVASADLQVPILSAQPGIFMVDGQNGAILHGDFSALSPSSPAARGETVALYATGLGSTTPALPTNVPAPVAPLSTVQAGCTVTVGGVAANVVFCGLAPGLVGVYQVNFTVPLNAASGSADVAIRVGSETSNTVKMAVQ